MNSYYRVVVDKIALEQLPNSLFLLTFLTNDLFFKCSTYDHEGNFIRLVIPSESGDGAFELVLILPIHLVSYIAYLPEEKKVQFGFGEKDR